MDMSVLPITVEDVRAAAGRIAGQAVSTPLVESPQLNALVGGRVLVKAECLQRTGSFKFRGAYNRISQLSPDETPGGVVAYSSGNHAQGVAAAAQIMGLPAVIVMPEDTPAIKRRNTEGYGAEVETFDRASQDRAEIAARIAAERGAVIVPPFDDLDIIAGQGTAGLEIAAQAKALGVDVDAVLVPHGGGGFTAGVATAIAAEITGASVYAVEPEGFDDLRRSLASGERETNESGTGSICDALLAWSPGEITFSINRHLLKGAFAVSDDEVRAAMGVAFDMLKLVVEPGGAVALAAVLSGKIDCAGRTVVAVVSGGNVDRAMFCSCVAGA